MGTVRRKISPHASRLRREATDAERLLWSKLRSRQLEGWKFRRQVTIEPYIVDFLCWDAGLIVEVDGSQHNEVVDAERTAFLKTAIGSSASGTTTSCRIWMGCWRSCFLF